MSEGRANGSERKASRYGNYLNRFGFGCGGTVRRWYESGLSFVVR